MRASTVLLGVAALLLVQAVIVLGGVYLMLGVFGDELDQELDRQVQRVERDLDADLDQVRSDVRRELRREFDARLPAAPLGP